MDVESVIISSSVTILSLGLLLLALAGYKKYKNIKLIFVSLVFVVLLVKGILFSFGLFNEDVVELLSFPYVGIFDLIILILLFISTLKR